MESIDNLVTRLGRCVGGKLADDVAVAVVELKAERDLAVDQVTLARAAEQKALAAETAAQDAEDALEAAEARIAELEEQARSAAKLLDSVPQP